MDLFGRKSDVVVGKTSPIIKIIWSKMAQLGLEESFEVEGFRSPKQAQIETNVCVRDLGGVLGRKKRRSRGLY